MSVKIIIMEGNSCIFCYSEVFPPEKQVGGKGEEENGGRSVRKLEQFIEQLDLDFKPEAVNRMCDSICQMCFSSLRRIVEFKNQADKMEGRARALQIQVLEQMSELYNCVEKFHNELEYMMRKQMGGEDNGGNGGKVNSALLEGVVQGQVCSEDAAILRSKVVENVRNRNFPQFNRKVPPPPSPVAALSPSSSQTRTPAVDSPVKLMHTKMNPVSIIPISIPVIPGLTKLNRKRKGDEISTAVKDLKEEADDNDIEILEEGPPKCARKGTPPKKNFPSPSTSDYSIKSSSVSEEDDSDSAESLFTPIVKPAVVSPRVNDPKLESMMPKVALQRLPPTPSPPQPPPKNKLEISKTEKPQAQAAGPVTNKKIVYFGDSESEESSSSSSSSEDEAPLITFPPRFKVSKWKQRIILGLFGKEKFKLAEKKRSKETFKEKWTLNYNKGTNKLSYGGTMILFFEEDGCIGCGGRKGKKACDFRTSHVEAEFFEGIRGHIERCHLGEGGGEKDDELGEGDDEWDADVAWATDDEEETKEVVAVGDKDDEVVEGKDDEVMRRSERVVKAHERLISENDKQEEKEEICQVCGKVCKDKRQLKMHTWDHHGHVEKLGWSGGGDGDGGNRSSLSLEERYKMMRSAKKFSSEDSEEGETDDDDDGSLLEI